MNQNLAAQDYPTVDFTGSCGEAKAIPNSATSTGMAPNCSATINGNSPDGCITGNDGAQVSSITLLNIAGPFAYQVSVYGQGPSGITSGSFYLVFTDESGGNYYLSIYSSTPDTHTVDYNSDSPNIVKIWWCDDVFTVATDSADAKTTKPNFRVTSPANK